MASGFILIAALELLNTLPRAAPFRFIVCDGKQLFFNLKTLIISLPQPISVAFIPCKNLRDFNSIEIDNIQLQNNHVLQNISAEDSKDEKLIVLSNDSTKTVDPTNNKEIKYNTLNESLYDTIVILL